MPLTDWFSALAPGSSILIRHTFLVNNMFYTRMAPELTNTLRVRFYDRNDNTPILAFTNYALADGGVSTTQPLTRLPHSYSRLNIADDLKWQPHRMWTFGAGYFFERYVYANGEVDATDESGVKGFATFTPWNWFTARSTLEYSQRRFENWLATSTDPASNAMRYFFVANRDLTKANTTIDVQLTKDVTVTPNGGVRWIEYPPDQVLNANNLATNSLGLHYDREWNIGADLGIRLTPEIRANFSYNYEEHRLYMQSCCGGSSSSIPFNGRVECDSRNLRFEI
jgi:hypothetical protein